MNTFSSVLTNRSTITMTSRLRHGLPWLMTASLGLTSIAGCTTEEDFEDALADDPLAEEDLLEGEAGRAPMVTSLWQKTRGTNTQNLLPDNNFLADLDGDGTSEFLQYSGTRIFANKPDFNKTGMLHAYLDRPISRLFTGDFSASGKDGVCVIQTDNGLRCYSSSSDNKTLWWWFTQNNFISSSEDIIVGDYDGNGRDDLMLYNRSTGGIRMYTVTGSAFFASLPSFALGNLSNVAKTGMQFRVGELNGDSRMDLLAINSFGQVLRYDSVYSGGQNTFWWAFTTSSGTVASGEQVTVARVTDDRYDDIVLHNKSTGANRLFYPTYENGWLKPITSISQGQIAIKANSLLTWARMHGTLNEPGATYRDDTLVIETSNKMMHRADARWSGTAYTYWWAYDQYAPNNQSGWAASDTRPWLVLKCRFKGSTAQPKTDQWLDELFTDAGYEGVVEYWRDISYGSWDVSDTELDPTWYTMSMTVEEGKSMSRSDRIQACVDAAGADLTGYVSVIALINENQDSGAAGGRVLLDPWCWNTTCATHEMAHIYGWGHAYSDDTSCKTNDWSQPGEYCDEWDIMSAMNVYTFSNHNGAASGTEMNAAYKMKKAFIPTHRQLRLIPGSAKVTKTVAIAAINRPEAFGPMLVRIGSNDSDYFTVEYREKSGWDRGIPKSAVLVHQVKNGTSYLLEKTGGAELIAGGSRTLSTGAKITVNSLSATAGTASVTILY